MLCEDAEIEEEYRQLGEIDGKLVEDLQEEETLAQEVSILTDFQAQRLAFKA